MQAVELRVIGIDHIPEVRPGMNLPGLILDAAQQSNIQFAPGDILVVTHKIVGKAEGQLVDLRTVEPSSFARQFGERYGKDPRQIEVVLRESTRIVRMARGIIISETRHGFICANAGVDASNILDEGMVCLLPDDPDASAARLYEEVHERLGFAVPILISDSFGRPWRNGIVNIAIGVAGLAPLVDYRGQTDPYGYTMSATIIAIADELCAAAELVMGKLTSRPVALIRGYHYESGMGSGKAILMDSAFDLFR